MILFKLKFDLLIPTWQAGNAHSLDGHGGKGLGALWSVDGRGLACRSGQSKVESFDSDNWLYALGAGEEIEIE